MLPNAAPGPAGRTQISSSGANVGTSLRVLGVQIIELATGNGAVDSGDLSVDDVAALFGKAEGYKSSEPAVRKAEETVGDGDSYDF